VSKKLTFLFFQFILVSQFVFAQKSRVKNLENFDKHLFHFGFSLGLNSANFIVRPNVNYLLGDSLYSLNAIKQPGFSLGIVSDMKIFENFNLRFIPCLTFTNRILEYNFKGPNSTQFTTVNKTVESTFLEFPLSLKFKSERVNNYRMYVLGGGKYTIDMSSNKDVEVGSGKEIIKINRNDFLTEVGVGMDFYLEYFKLSPEIKYAFGVKNLLVNDNTIFSNSIERLNSKIIYFSLTFE
jgi:hypothetical protein